MSNNESFQKLINSLKTTQDRSLFLSICSDLLDALFSTIKEDFDNVFAKGQNLECVTLLREVLQDLTIEDKRVFLEDLKKVLEDLKIIGLTVAFDPSDDAIREIHNAVTRNIGEGYIIDFNKDESILGGAIITFEGNYEDLSTKKRLEAYFEENKKEILSYLN